MLDYETHFHIDDEIKRRNLTVVDILICSSPHEKKFKMALIELVMEGIYPSGRQIYKKIGKDVNRKVNLNGRECKWKDELFAIFKIEPYVGYTKRLHRTDWNIVVKQAGPYLWRRKGHELEYIGDWL
jgi:hypothetical protein